MTRLILTFLLLQLLISCHHNEKSDSIITQENNEPIQVKNEGSRQIHLDFHNSEFLEDIGARFDKEQFVNALKNANVNSINVFAKCHHGWCYYNTEIGERHPNLNFDLLKAQIDACKEAGIRVQAYFTIGWSVKDAQEHPEWRLLDKEGKTSIHDRVANLGPDDPLPTVTWELLSPEGKYLELIHKQTEELMSNYDLDGMWFDIVPIWPPNYNESSKADMKTKGIDIQDDQAVNEYHVKKMEYFMETSNEIVKRYNPDASIFYNWSTHMRIENTFTFQTYRHNTKLDLEDLPTTWEGYDIFPLRAKYFSNTNMPITGMSGKFHTYWGEFGGYKYPEALKFEAASMVAMGANVNFGDQLHPSGLMDEWTYSNLKPAFDYVAEIETYGIGGHHVSDLGVWMSFRGKSDEGMAKMLLENQMNFVVANNYPDIHSLKVIILSSDTKLNQEDIIRLQKYIEQGGNLITSGKSGLAGDGTFIFDVGLNYIGDAQYDVDYTFAGNKVNKNVIGAPFLNYIPAIRTEVIEGTEILARIYEPYFSRTKRHYTSHQNTPYRNDPATHPAITRKSNVIFIAHELDKIYYENGSRIHRELFINVLNEVYEEPMLKVEMPSAGRVNLLHFPERRQFVIHLLYGTPHQRGRAQVIEDLVPLFNIPIKFTQGMPIRNAFEIPSNKHVEFQQNRLGIELNIPKLEMHTAIVLEY